ncbi:MAG: Ig-like domain-containing protein, partial [Planctomycetota bacterium]
MSLSNLGHDSLVITSVEVIDPTGSFSIDPIAAGSLLVGGGSSERGNRLPIDIQFDPTLATGNIDGQIKITFDSSADPLLVDVSGNGISPVGDLRVDIANNNVGGQAVDDGVKSVSFGVLRNTGSDDLNIFGIESDARNAGQFTLGGLPFTPTLAQPIVIPPGGEVPFQMLFDPDSPGLRAGSFKLITDDPDGVGEQFSVVGTGTDGSVANPAGNFVAYEDPHGGPESVLRTRSDRGGNFELFVAAEQFFRVTAFDPSTGLLSQHHDVTRPSGQSTPVNNNNNYRASESQDTDGDGLPDDVEKTIGTDPNRIDTNGDGISDFAHIQSGLDPLSGLTSNTGAIGGVSPLGESLAVVVRAAQGDEGRLAYVASGSQGLGIIDVSDPFSPIILSDTDLSGEARGVDIDERLNIAAISADDAGVHFVNVRNPAKPLLLSTNFEPAGASFVSVFEGIAFVAAGETLFALDMVTFRVTDRFLIGSGTITGLSRDGSTLFAHDASKTLHSFDISAGKITPLASITLADGGGQLFVGGGVAYATVPGTQAGGFTTVDVSDPTTPTLLGRSNAQPGVALARTDIATNGSGSAVLVGDLSGVGGGFVLDIFDVSDPATTTQLTTTLPLMTDPRDVVLADGLAFVAGGTGGLRILNYLPFDVGGEAPTVTITSPIEDEDPGKEGLQILEGSTIPLVIDVNDDVQVRSLELLRDGESSQTEISFPYEFSAIAPDTEGALFELSVRATDTGGNIGLSNTLRYELIPDVFPPQVDMITPANGAVVGQGFESIEINYTKKMSTSASLAANYTLVRGQENIAPLDVQLRNDGQTAVLLFAPLQPGSYSLTLDGTSILDRAGNALSASPSTTRFTVADFTSRWIGTDGFWDDPTNWSGGVVPDDDDFVLIDVPGDHTITHRTTDTKVAGIISRESFFQQSGSFTVTGSGDFRHLQLPSGVFTSDSSLSVQDLELTGILAELKINSEAEFTGDSLITAGKVTGVGEVLNSGILTIRGNGVLEPTFNNVGQI